MVLPGDGPLGDDGASGSTVDASTTSSTRGADGSGSFVGADAAVGPPRWRSPRRAGSTWSVGHRDGRVRRQERQLLGGAGQVLAVAGQAGLELRDDVR